MITTIVNITIRHQISSAKKKLGNRPHSITEPYHLDYREITEPKRYVIPLRNRGRVPLSVYRAICRKCSNFKTLLYQVIVGWPF